ncbi:DNA-protecting protein DprA [Siccibacter colletis]|uniref:DNA-protecting protein DprA n=1 Tax=Siccibacter colletis TaxID=1505757 RepID=UPI003CF5DBF7
MSPTEIWLRLMAVQSMNGEQMRCAANFMLSGAMKITDIAFCPQVTAAQAAQFCKPSEKDIDAALGWLDLPNHALLTVDDPAYPPQLRAIDWFPGAIFVAGDTKLLSQTQLAVVGSRNQSWYGEQWGRTFCEALASSGLVITSGLALGIDGVAHRAALAAHGKTVAVPGSGFHHLYPKRHTRLAQEIVENGGALVSEFPLTTTPWPGNFPRRNRIISGLSVGTFVVEASHRSGSLITARYALEQGREVFALPGPLGNPGSEGTHALIRQGAVLVSQPEDILEYLHSELHWLHSAEKNGNKLLNQEALPLPFPELLANVGDEVTPVDVVAERAGQPVPVAVAQLLELELAGWIAAVPGGYVRLRRASHVRRTNVFI